LSIDHKIKIILSTLILLLYVVIYLVERGGYADTLSPAAALTTGLVLAFAGGIVVGVTSFYLWDLWKKARRGGAAKPEEHAA
jgi:hypothetical protein